ncbi:MAG: 1-acyl-sn-glycerol-3-phosphate acyltransferase [Bacteroidales bacterium]
MKVVDSQHFESLSPLFRGTLGHRLAEAAMRLLAIDKVNQVYHNSGQFTGAAFTQGLLNDLGVNYLIGHAERLKALPQGPFITIANHPYGGLDGVILVDLMAGIRPDYKLMVNEMLSRVKTLSDNFISVTPTGNFKKGISAASLHGIRKTLAHIREGHPAGFFPSGAVSDLSLRDLRVRDRKWQDSVLHLIHRVKVPILPIRFFDGNSPYYYLLGLLNWRIRVLRVPSELFNKRNQVTRVGVGQIISVEEQDQFPDPASFGVHLRKMVYEMALPGSFTPRSDLEKLLK